MEKESSFDGLVHSIPLTYFLTTYQLFCMS